MKKKWFVLACPLFLLSLAFDPANDNPASFSGEADLVHLLDVEKALVSAHRQAVDEKRGIGTVDDCFGADPYRVRYLPQTDRYLFLLRNASTLVLCDGNLKIIDRAGTIRRPVAFDLVENEILLVGGELSGTINRFRIGSKRIEKLPDIDMPQVVSIRDLVYVPDADRLFLIDDYSRRLIQVELPATAIRQSAPRLKSRSFPMGAGPSRILSVKDHLIVNLMLDHTLQIIPFHSGTPDFSQTTEITNAGPFWAMDARVVGRTLVIAAGGIENHPLRRETGEFGYLDSFLYLFTLERDQTGRYRWHESDRTNTRRYRSMNLSEQQILTPKAVALRDIGNAEVELWVSGYGSDRLIAYSLGAGGVMVERKIRVMPGVSDLVVSTHQTKTSLVYVSPLMDRAVKLNPGTGKVLAELTFESAVGSRNRFMPLHLGELLFYTDLMSPNNSSADELSRFTCEACHFEGRIDGRIHYTGRDDIYATTKPLYGLANNVPLFSRGGDESLSSMVMAEFIVANQRRKAFFTIRKEHYPWMSTVDDWPDTLTPLALREGLLAFFMALAPPPHAWRAKHPDFNDRARQGMAVFRDRCADCHQPIRSTRTEDGVKFEEWTPWLTDEKLDLVWGAPFFSRTGITPYVDPAGARVPSLRRIWMKYPLFTNGSAKTMRDLLEGFRYQGATVYHHFDGTESAMRNGLKSLTPTEIDDLEMLLRYF